MKKLILICGLALVGFTSCKKTWTCDCTGTIGSTSQKIPLTIPDQKKSDAKTTCNNYQELQKITYTSFGGDFICDLK